MEELGIAAAAGVAGAAGFAAYAVRGRSSAVFGRSVHRGDPARPVLALTFDDGPSESTPQLLSILDWHRVPATFFMCGCNIRRCPQAAREVAARGHEIANHTDTHPLLFLHSADFIYEQIARAQDTIHSVTGVAPRWFRAPYGVRWIGVGAAQERVGVTGVMWTVIARDWALSGGQIAERLLRFASNGGILCLHDGRGVRTNPDIRATLEAVDALIPRLCERGFAFQTLSDMLLRSPREIVATQ